MKTLKAISSIVFALLAQSVYSAPTVQIRSTWEQACPNAKAGPGIAPIAAILAPAVIDAVVDHAAASLKAASDSETKQFTASTSTGLFYEVNNSGELSLNRMDSCLIVIRGEFEGQSITKEYFRLEIERKAIPDSDYFRLEPRYFKASKLEIGNWLSKTGDYSVSVSLYAPAASPPYGSATFTFEQIKEGTEIKIGDYRLEAAYSDPIPYPEVLEDANGSRDKQAKAAAPYLLALGVLKRQKKELENTADQRAISNPKPDPLDLATVKILLKNYCNAESNDNLNIPSKQRVRSERCAIDKSTASRRLEEGISRANLSSEIKRWAEEICIDWNYKDQCNKAFALEGTKKPTGLFVTKTILTETRNANIYGQKLAGILGAASDDLKKEFKSKLPDAKEAAEKANDTEDRTSLYTYSLALSKLNVAKYAYTSTSKQDEKLDAHIKLVEACFAANEAGIAVGMPPACPQYE